MRLILLFFLFYPAFLLGTQTALFWTYCTTDVVPYGKGNFEVANLFKAVNTIDTPGPFSSRVPESMLPTDFGFDVGLFSCAGWQGEFGIDFFPGTDNPLYLNAKVAIDENKLFWHAPSFSVGIFNVGFSHNTSFNVVGIVVGKKIPWWCEGRLLTGGYVGNSFMGDDPGGWWIGFDLPFYKKKDCKGNDFYRWRLLADYATGRNIVGGGGIGLSYFYNADIYFSTGPTWFNSARIYGTWKWSFYLNVVFPVIKPLKCCRY